MQTMQKTRFSKSLSFIVCIVLIAAMALFTIGCNDNTKTTNPDTSQDTHIESPKDPDVLGEGEHRFTFTVVDADGKESTYEIQTDKTVVGEALLDLGLIAGDEEQYGLYVKTVNGITVDYDSDGKYWAFYIDGEYAMTGVDSTEITEGSTYTFKVE